jgi:hypothetical protein
MMQAPAIYEHTATSLMYTRHSSNLRMLSRYYISLHIYASNTHSTTPTQLYYPHIPSTVLTQRADFSETKENVDSDDNDWLSWQYVSTRGKKRAAPRTT